MEQNVKQLMNLAKGHMGVLCTIFDIFYKSEIYQNKKLPKNQLYSLHLKERDSFRC